MYFWLYVILINVLPMGKKFNNLNHFAKCCKVENNYKNKVYNIDKNETEEDKFVILNIVEVNGNSWVKNIKINNWDRYWSRNKCYASKYI